jgi:hypothetical protein
MDESLANRAVKGETEGKGKKAKGKSEDLSPVVTFAFCLFTSALNSIRRKRCC